MNPHMRNLALLFALLSTPAWAQRGNGYAFIAPGGATCCGTTQTTLHAGAGGEIALWKGLGAGVEVGALGPTDRLSNGFGVASANGYYHLPGFSDRKWDPFVTGGYSFLWKMGHVNAANFGAGANYWLARHVGLRVEARDQVRTSGTAVNYWGVRFGVAFR